MGISSLPDTNGAERITVLTPSEKQHYWFNSFCEWAVSFISSSYFSYFPYKKEKTSWLIRPLSESKEFFLRKPGILFTVCQSACFLGRLLHCKNHTDLNFFVVPASSRSISSLSRLFLASAAFQKRRSNRELSPGPSRTVRGQWDFSPTSWCGCYTKRAFLSRWPSVLFGMTEPEGTALAARQVSTGLVMLQGKDSSCKLTSVYFWRKKFSSRLLPLSSPYLSNTLLRLFLELGK